MLSALARVAVSKARLACQSAQRAGQQNVKRLAIASIPEFLESQKQQWRARGDRQEPYEDAELAIEPQKRQKRQRERPLQPLEESNHKRRKSGQCRCGSTTHSRTTHADCPMNKLDRDEVTQAVPQDGLEIVQEESKHKRNKSGQCRCGSTSHSRTTHADCPMKKATRDEAVPQLSDLAGKTACGKCRCGSSTHSRTTHATCPLNKSPGKAALASDGQRGNSEQQQEVLPSLSSVDLH